MVTLVCVVVVSMLLISAGMEFRVAVVGYPRERGCKTVS